MVESYTFLTTNTPLQYETVEKGKARVDAVLAAVLRNIGQTDDYAKVRSAISAQLLDLWLTRINVNAVFTPSQKDAIKVPRLCESTDLKNLYLSSSLHVLMEMVEEERGNDG